MEYVFVNQCAADSCYNANVRGRQMCKNPEDVYELQITE